MWYTKLLSHQGHLAGFEAGTYAGNTVRNHVGCVSNNIFVGTGVDAVGPIIGVLVGFEVGISAVLSTIK